MKVHLAAVLEPRILERKRLTDALKKAGLKVSQAQEVQGLGREQLVLLGPGVKQAARVARQIREALPNALLLAGQRRVTRVGHADGVLPLPISPLDLKVRLPELLALQGVDRKVPRPRPGDGITDPLTGFYTFAHFKEVLFIEVKRARRYGFPLSIALASFDALAVPMRNDLKAQLFGGLAMAVRRSLRDTDLPVQYGPERVLLLMPHTDLQGALVVSRRICERVARASLTHGDVVVRPTVSLGLSATPSQRGEFSFSDLSRQAQLSLESAVTLGGNRVEFWDSAAPPPEGGGDMAPVETGTEGKTDGTAS